MQIRRAVLSDLESIVMLLAEDPLGQTREDSKLPLSRQYLDAFTAIEEDKNQLLVVGIEDETVIACLQISFIPGLSRLGMWRGQIESVRVGAKYRGKGIGRMLFQWSIEQCRKRACGIIQLTTDKARPEALRFYESLGFVSSHEGMKMLLSNEQ